MELITVRELFKNIDKYADKVIEIGGWVRNRRPSKQFGFIMLNDGTYFNPVQVVYNDTIENFQEISKINIGAALIIKGKVVLTPDSKQPFEIQAETVTVEGPSTGDFPPAAQASLHGVSAYHYPSASQNQHLPGCVPCALPGCHGPPQVLPGA